MARLYLTYNNIVLNTHRLVSDSEIFIGRDSNSHICIDHPAVSQQHAKIIYNGEGLQLLDLDSTNGTIVNDEKVMTCQLTHQDWIVVGKHLIIVDLHETLSLEAKTQMPKAGSSGVAAADGTILMDRDQLQSGMQVMEFLSFASEDKEDFELSGTVVSIGKNKDADILIKGLWAFLAGEPAARIEKHGSDYYLEYVTGMLNPKINNTPIRKRTKLNHKDLIKIGPVRMQFHRIQRNLSPN